MTSLPWIKLYTEILHDPKMERLSDHLWRRVGELFLLAQEYNAGGYLPDLTDMAWTLRTTDEALLADLQALTVPKLEIVKEIDGQWFVTNFATRQDAETNAERQRRYRERQQKQHYYGNNNVTNGVTESNTDSNENIPREEESREEEEGEREETSAAANSFQFYEENIGMLTPMIADAIKDAEQTYPAEWIRLAIKEAVDSNARNWKYVEAILKRWQKDGIGSDKRGKRNGKYGSPAVHKPEDYTTGEFAEFVEH